MSIESWLLSNLVCPRDHKHFIYQENRLVCSDGHTYPVVEDIPILLLEDVQPTHPIFQETLAKAQAEKSQAEKPNLEGDEIDPFVQEIIVGTCGNLYRPLLNKLNRYPIPDIKLPPGSGQLFLEVGCNWGRWCVSAAQKGYVPVGIDPSFDGVFAAKRIAQQLGVRAYYVVADSRHLPFLPEMFDVVFSYSVLQHLAKENVRISLAEIARVMKPTGFSLIQMPNTFGVHNLFVQARNLRKETGLFDVRYWRPAELRQAFTRHIGPTRLFVDGYFSLNPQPTDMDLLPLFNRSVVGVSELLRKLSERFSPLLYVADSLYVRSCKA